MAWTDDYFDVDYYKARVRKATTGDDTEIEEQIGAVCRWLEQPKQLGRVFNQSAAGVVRYFQAVPDLAADREGRWPALLRVDDLVTLSAIAVDLDRDASYGTAVDTGDVRLKPYNAALDARPYTALELIPTQTTIAGWPDYPAAVKVTGVWGWPSVPEAVKELGVMIVRQVRDLQESGITVTVQALDGQIQMAPGASALMKQLKATYARREFWF